MSGVRSDNKNGSRFECSRLFGQRLRALAHVARLQALPQVVERNEWLVYEPSKLLEQELLLVKQNGWLIQELSKLLQQELLLHLLFNQSKRHRRNESE